MFKRSDRPYGSRRTQIANSHRLVLHSAAEGHKFPAPFSEEERGFRGSRDLDNLKRHGMHFKLPPVVCYTNGSSLVSALTLEASAMAPLFYQGSTTRCLHRAFHLGICLKFALTSFIVSEFGPYLLGVGGPSVSTVHHQ